LMLKSIKFLVVFLLVSSVAFAGSVGLRAIPREEIVFLPGSHNLKDSTGGLSAGTIARTSDDMLPDGSGWARGDRDILIPAENRNPVGTLGSTLVNNGDFATGDGTGWSEAGGGTATEDYTDNELTVTLTGAGSKVYDNSLTISDGKIYFVSITVRDYAAGANGVNIYAGSTLMLPSITANGTYSGYYVSGSDETKIRVGWTGSYAGTESFTIDDVVVKELTQDSWWTETNCFLDEDGGIIADSTDSEAKELRATNIVVNPTNETYLFQVKLLKGAKNFARLRSWNGTDGATNAFFDLDNGIEGQLAGDPPISSGIAGPDGEGYYTCWLVATLNASTHFYINPSATSGAAGVAFAAADTTNPLIYFKEIMLEEVPSDLALGEELVTDGDFSEYTGSDPTVDFTHWTEQETSGNGDFDYNGGAEITIATQPTGSTSIRIYQNVTVEGSTFYKISATFTGGAGNTATGRLTLSESGGDYTTFANVEFASDGTTQDEEVYILTDSDVTTLSVICQWSTQPDVGDIALWESVSVKEVPLSVWTDALGPELNPNTDLSGTGGATSGSGTVNGDIADSYKIWADSGVTATAATTSGQSLSSADGTSVLNHNDNIDFKNGESYLVEWTISAITGTVTFDIRTTSGSQANLGFTEQDISSTGTYRGVLNAAADISAGIFAIVEDGEAVTITNVSCKKLDFHIQPSPYTNASTIPAEGVLLGRVAPHSECDCFEFD
jgi:hypothetical protein